jgi:hypothetical protein
MPALLKGFLEQVARPGFAFAARAAAASARKLLGGRSARVVVTMGMPALVYRWYFMAHSVKALERNVLGFVGIAPVHAHADRAVQDMTDARRARWLAEMNSISAHRAHSRWPRARLRGMLRGAGGFEPQRRAHGRLSSPAGERLRMTRTRSTGPTAALDDPATRRAHSPAWETDVAGRRDRALAPAPVGPLVRGLRRCHRGGAAGAMQASAEAAVQHATTSARWSLGPSRTRLSGIDRGGSARPATTRRRMPRAPARALRLRRGAGCAVASLRRGCSA